ncbi:hypothetical protein QJS04_geneDACA014378 [Acorus gramineus]|uniref:Uncharacterized protein n=1 Tax=Acorus gramineus TaxID=55184 RepID=A0AAV9A1H6_ACOGR|nr:hypothetical protein QJS04_geneDACA014378 [Acorus gramineus]
MRDKMRNGHGSAGSSVAVGERDGRCSLFFSPGGASGRVIFFVFVEMKREREKGVGEKKSLYVVHLVTWSPPLLEK